MLCKAEKELLASSVVETEAISSIGNRDVGSDSGVLLVLWLAGRLSILIQCPIDGG